MKFNLLHLTLFCHSRVKYVRLTQCSKPECCKRQWFINGRTWVSSITGALCYITLCSEWFTENTRSGTRNRIHGVFWVRDLQLTNILLLHVFCQRKHPSKRSHLHLRFHSTPFYKGIHASLSLRLINNPAEAARSTGLSAGLWTGAGARGLCRQAGDGQQKPHPELLLSGCVGKQ